MNQNKKIERLFQVAAGILLLDEGYFAYVENFDRVFVLAAVGALCFFIGIRFQVKERLRLEDLENNQDELIEEGTFRPANDVDVFEKGINERDN